MSCRARATEKKWKNLCDDLLTVPTLFVNLSTLYGGSAFGLEDAGKEGCCEKGGISQRIPPVFPRERVAKLGEFRNKDAVGAPSSCGQFHDKS